MNYSTLSLIVFVIVCTLIFKQKYSKKVLKLIVVIDGDTYIGCCPKGRHYRLRILGLDCPETDQEHGKYVTNQVRSCLLNSHVAVNLKGRDQFRRHLAHIKHPSLGCVRKHLIKNGWAYPEYTRDFHLHWSARLNKRGIFNKGNFKTKLVHPSVFKRKHRYFKSLKYLIKKRVK